MSSEFKNLREFGCFRLDPHRKVLWVNGEPVNLALKEIEILCVLTESEKAVVTKEELLDRVWGDSFVEEGNLSQHVYRLRKTFEQHGEPTSLIQTIPRRGYRFTGEITVMQEDELVSERRAPASSPIGEMQLSDNGTDTDALPHEQISHSRVRLSWRFVVFLSAFVFVVFAGFAAATYFGAFGETPVNSVAVLPIKMIGSDSDGDVQSIGLTDSLINQLGRAEGLRVVSLRTVTGPRFENADPADIGREINVDAVLDGTMQRNGDELRISLRLVRSRNGEQLWTTTIRENAQNIFKLQDSIAFEAARALSRTIRTEQVKHLTENREAYEAFLRGRFFLDKRTGDDYKNAKSEFERAIAIEPQFAAAYSGLADVIALQANTSNGAQRDALYNESKAMALEAREADPTSAHARTSLGWVKRVHEWDWEGAEADFRKAIELDPNYVTARQWYALLLTSLGRHDEAHFQIEKARELEPLSKSVLLNYFAVQDYRGEYGNLRSIAEHAQGLEEPSPTNIRLLATAHYRNGDYAKVVELGESAIAYEGGRIRSDYLAKFMAMSYAALGDSANSKRFLDHLLERSTKRSEAAYRLAVAFSALGEREKALDLLERCYNERDDRMVWLKVEPAFASLSGEPRFQALLTKMRLA